MNRRKIFIAIAGFTLIVAFSNQLFFSTVKSHHKSKIGGFNLVAPRRPFTIDSLQRVKDTGAEWIAVVPYAFCNAKTAEITFNHSRQWWGEKPEGVIETIRIAKTLGFRVMLKPHLWVGGQGWAGDLKFQSDSLWQVFEQQYSQYILTYAKIADSLHVDLYCIGTELRQSTAERKHFWPVLIKQTKDIFRKELTYAANWDEYNKIEFWPDLDYIGIDAYFPLSNAKSPSKEDLKAAWKLPKKMIRNFSEQHRKPILFTEFGYESIDYNTMGHWKLSKDSLSVNFQNQKVAFEALFDVFRAEDWWKGGFIWKWHLNRNGLKDRNIKAYTPQDKPAIHAISNEFKRNF